jgi:hypothetical protein
MKFRTQFFITVALLILGMAWLTYATIFPSTINRDCAPWDGAAFTLSISMEDGTVIYVSIWQSPDIKLPVIFSIPDETGQIGVAYILPEPDTFHELSGEVSFRRVEVGIPVEGVFDLETESGEQFKGKFKAEWGNEVVYCG